MNLWRNFVVFIAHVIIKYRNPLFNAILRFANKNARNWQKRFRIVERINVLADTGHELTCARNLLNSSNILTSLGRVQRNLFCFLLEGVLAKQRLLRLEAELRAAIVKPLPHIIVIRVLPDGGFKISTSFDSLSHSYLQTWNFPISALHTPTITPATKVWQNINCQRLSIANCKP